MYIYKEISLKVVIFGCIICRIKPQNRDKKEKEKKEKTKKKGMKTKKETIVGDSLKNFSLAMHLLPIGSSVWDYVETNFFW